MGIKRIWHGWTTPENAEAYRTVLFGEVIPGNEAKGIEGYRGIEVLQRDLGIFPPEADASDRPGSTSPNATPASGGSGSYRCEPQKPRSRILVWPAQTIFPPASG